MKKPGKNQCSTEWALWASEKRFKSLMQHCRDGVVLTEDNRIKQVNPALLVMVESRLECLYGKPIETLFSPPPPRWQAEGNPATQYAMAGHSHCKLISGTSVAVARWPIDHHAALGMLWFITDLSSDEDVAAERIKARQMASIAALSGGIAHDYNNLLTAIIGNLSLLKDRLADGDPLHGIVDEAQAASSVAKDLTQRLITFSKGGAPRKEKFALSPLVRNATMFSLSGSTVDAAFDLPNALWLVAGDQTQIGQAIHHLVTNAAEAMPAGGTISVAAENVVMTTGKGLLAPGNYIKIGISDSGVGILAADLEHVFDPYFTTKSRGKNKGTGLGLSIARSIVENHGGDIFIVSSPEKGTTASIYLPAMTQNGSQSDHPDVASGNENVHQPIHGHGRILLMDDEQMIRELADNMLRHLGYEVDFAEEGQAAINLYHAAQSEGRPYDAVILDLTIRGGMGGAQAIKALRHLDPHVRALVSSGYSDDPILANHESYGFIGVVAKPYDITELSQQLHRVLFL